MNTTLVLTNVAMMGGLTFVLASLLVVATRCFYVEEDPRVATVEALLPNSNCG